MDELKSELRSMRADLLEHYNDDTKRLASIEKCIIRMEEDVRHHIERTNKLQEMTEPMYKAFIGTKWSIGAILTLGFLITAIAKIKGIL